MKRIILMILSICLIFAFAACDDGEKLAERSIDGVAAYLGYTDGEEIPAMTMNKDMEGAIAGKYFKDGQVSIYEFDPDSAEYEFQKSQTDTCVGGFVLIYDYLAIEGMMDDEIHKQTLKIQGIKFKTE